jgi:Ca-activated chloride channel family protein
MMLIVVLGICNLGNAQKDDGQASQTGLYLSGKTKLIPLPLASTRVRGEIRGFVAKIHVTQVYVNPYDAVIEATYVFPLSEKAAVTSMIMHLADRDVVAKIHQRKKAEEIYQEAVDAGHTAALMTQERSNIFTQKVGNIPAGDKVEVELTYVEALSYDRGVSRFVFPTIVGPRFIPGTPLRGPDLEPSGRIPDTDRVPDASRISPPVLAENQTSAHRIDLELVLLPGLPITKIHSPSHQLLTERPVIEKAIVRLAPMDRVPNKDFVLKVDLRGKRPEAAVLTHRQEGRDGYLTLAIQPPSLPLPTQIAPKDLFFVVDNSGSMHGAPIEACKDLIRQALKHMNSRDRFTIMRFSDSVSALSAEPLDNYPENVDAGLKFVDQMSGMGSTNMISGIRRALAGKPETGRVRIVFFLTDGYIGNDSEILKAVQEENQAQARLFSLGVGSSVNRYLLTSMARLGRGEVQYVRYDQDPEPVIEQFYRRVRNPVLTHVELDWGDLEIYDQTPTIIKDLFDNQPLIVHARYKEAKTGTLRLNGWVGNQKFQSDIVVTLPKQKERPDIANLWARARIEEWMDEETSWPGRREEEITELALAHSLMSKYTAFVAVDREVVNRMASEPLIPVAQRLPLPDGVERTALGSLSRQQIPPGDPIISVAAPADARRVTAYFPFGLIKDLRYDEIRTMWRGRFLVPEGIKDGEYSIRVAVELRSGRVISHRMKYVLDSQAEEFVVRFSSDWILAGDALEVHVDSVEPAVEVYLDCSSLGWERVQLSSQDNGNNVDWVTWLTVNESTLPGEYEVRFVVRDQAGNRLEQTKTINVYWGNSRSE